MSRLTAAFISLFLTLPLLAADGGRATGTMKLDGFSPGGTTRFESEISTTTPGPETDVRPAARSAFAGFCQMRMRG